MYRRREDGGPEWGRERETDLTKDKWKVGKEPKVHFVVTETCRREMNRGVVLPGRKLTGSSWNRQRKEVEGFGRPLSSHH